MAKSKINLQDRMASMKPYFKGIEMYNEALIVKVVFPTNWKAYDSQDGKIKVTPSDTNPNESYYYASSEDTSYDDIFDLIEETIKANQDIILKLELLKKKIEELKEVFSSHSYDELCSLSFVLKYLWFLNLNSFQSLSSVIVPNLSIMILITARSRALSPMNSRTSLFCPPFSSE